MTSQFIHPLFLFSSFAATLLVAINQIKISARESGVSFKEYCKLTILFLMACLLSSRKQEVANKNEASFPESQCLLSSWGSRDIINKLQPDVLKG